MKGYRQLAMGPFNGTIWGSKVISATFSRGIRIDMWS